MTVQVMPAVQPPALTGDGEGVVQGLRDSAPAAFAAVPLGLAFGVLVAQAGLSWWWGTVFAVVIFAGSFEFLLLGLVATAASVSQIAATALLVNVRHVFYAVSFPLPQVRGWAKLYSTFALTDEAWALTASPAAAGWRQSRILTLQGAFHAAWAAAVTVGALLGAAVPESVQGLDFALTALFLVLGLEAYRADPNPPLPLVAAACFLVARVVLGESMVLVGAIGLFLAFLVCRHLVRGSRA
jgi:4-azaleucine resistance transporter AzlC